MSMNDTPSGDRLHIGFFGRRNAGKSSVVNAVTGQDLSVVSDTRGTTTDPVSKAMELLPLGPVVIIDTPGFDDVGSLGELRVRKTRQVLNRTDVAVLVVDAAEGMHDCDNELVKLFEEKKIPYIIAWNKSDLLSEIPESKINELYVSATKGTNIYELKELIGKRVVVSDEKYKLVSDMINPGDFVILVIPIDKAAPKGRIILPQQQVIRDILDTQATAICINENEIKQTIDNLKIKPALVITDSQVFEKVSKDVPEDIPLTSFSILMARKKGILEQTLRGVKALDTLKDGDCILISEGCTHHRQCDDIGTVKLPGWIRKYTGKDLSFETSSGKEFPEDVSKYAMVVHCGGCMLNEKEVRYRIQCSWDQDVPVSNYGMVIAYMNGILKRTTKMIPGLEDII